MLMGFCAITQIAASLKNIEKTSQHLTPQGDDMFKYFRELLETLKSIDERLKQLDRLQRIDKGLAAVTGTCRSGEFIRTGSKFD